MCRWKWIAGGTLLFAVGILTALAGAAPSGLVADLRGPTDLRIIGEKPLDHLGRSAAVGDFNDDGRPDLAVGADDSDPNGNVSGQVYVFFGAPVVTGSLDMAEDIPDLAIWGATDEGRLGHNMTVADLNGDEVDDLIVLDYNAGPPDRRTAGTTHVFFGGTQTWDRPLIDMLHTSGDVVIWGAVDGEHAGAVYAVADVNGDGIDDLVLGAPASDRTEERILNNGAVYVVDGRRDLAGIVDLQTEADLTIRGAVPAGFFGSSLGLGDVDGDGNLDLAVGVPGLDRDQVFGTGAVYIFSDIGAMSGLIDLQSHAPDLVLWGVSGGRAGSALAAGDVNGDGLADLLIGAPTASLAGRYRAGAAYLVLGPLDIHSPEVDLVAVIDVVVWGPAANARAGEAVALWDLGGDGLADVLVNAPEADVSGRPKAGLLAVWSGRPLFGSPVLDLAVDQPDLAVWGDDEYTRGTWYLVGTGDLDNNDHPDLLVGITETRPKGRNGAGTVYGLFNLAPLQPTPMPSPSTSPSSTPAPTLTATATPTVTLSSTATPTSPPPATPTAITTTTPSPTVTASPTLIPTPTATTATIYMALVARK